MSEQVTNYQCPACTGPLHYNGATGRLECEYCGSTFDVAQAEALYARKEENAAENFAAEEKKTRTAEPQGDGQWDTSGFTEDWGADAQGLKVYSCPSCGADLICDATTAATSCPYCSNPTVVPGQFRGSLKPDFVIPFKLSKEDAMKALKRHYGGKVFLPRSFTRENHVQEIKGVYVPFWMFDGAAEGNARYKATRSQTYRRGDTEFTDTRHFDIYRAGSIEFEKIPVDASSKMPDDYMDSIEPYDYSELRPFSTAYLPGFLADKYDVTVKDSQERADRRCKNTLESALRNTVTLYDTCVPAGSDIRIRRGKVHYALMPVWMLNTKWNGKDYLFAMNGQTGRLVGDLPVSWGRFWRLFAAIALPLSILGTIISILLV